MSETSLVSKIYQFGATPDFFPIILLAPSYVCPLWCRKLRLNIHKISFIAFTTVTLFTFFLTHISQESLFFTSRSSSSIQMQNVNWFGVLICNCWKNKRFLRIFPGLESKAWLDMMFNNSFPFLWWENIFPVAPSKWAIVPLYTAWKVSKYGVFLVRISLYLDRIRRFTP